MPKRRYGGAAGPDRRATALSAPLPLSGRYRVIATSLKGRLQPMSGSVARMSTIGQNRSSAMTA